MIRQFSWVNGFVAELRAYLRFRLIEWLMWSAALIFFSAILPGGHGLNGSFSHQVSACMLSALSLVAFATVYLYILFAYPILSVAAFLVAVVIYRGRSIGPAGWLLVNVMVPGGYGAFLLIDIYGGSPDIVMWCAWMVVVLGNTFFSRKEGHCGHFLKGQKKPRGSRLS